MDKIVEKKQVINFLTELKRVFAVRIGQKWTVLLQGGTSPLRG